jgi:hypothetical protein
MKHCNIYILNELPRLPKLLYLNLEKNNLGVEVVSKIVNNYPHLVSLLLADNWYLTEIEPYEYLAQLS